MTIEERVNRTINRLAVVEHILALKGLEAAGDIPPMNKAALMAGLCELIELSYADLKPIEDAPFEISNWEPDEPPIRDADEQGRK